MAQVIRVQSARQVSSWSLENVEKRGSYGCPWTFMSPLSSKPENLSQKRKELALNLKLETRMCMVPLNSI